MLIRDLSNELDAKTMTAVSGGDNSDIYVLPAALGPACIKPAPIASIWNPVAIFPVIGSLLHPTPEIVDPNNPLLQ